MADRNLGTGNWYDGLSARAHLVEVILQPDEVVILSAAGEEIRRWKLAEMRNSPRHGDSGTASFMAHPTSDERLVLRGYTAGEQLAAEVRNLRETEGHGRGYLGRVFLWAGAAAGSIYLILFILVPWLAVQMSALIPHETERQIGQAALEQIEWVFMSEGSYGECDDPAGRAALEAMLARFEPHYQTELPVEVLVRDIDIPNAFAVPGGMVVLFTGLFDVAESPEMVAGVLGHEIGHVVYRHPLASALRATGSAGVLGLVFGDFSGGTIALILSERLISAKYSQTAEAEADEFAVALLGDAGLPASALAEFFDWIAGEFGSESELLSHLSSHPEIAERAVRAREASQHEEGFEPVLNKKQWAALQAICG